MEKVLILLAFAFCSPCVILIVVAYIDEINNKRIMKKAKKSYDKKLNDAMRFYLLATSLKYKIRSGWDETHWNVSKERIESIAEHVYGTCILALSIDSEFETNLDINKVVKMLVIHELGEVVIGDITPFDNITPEEKMEKEKRRWKLQYDANNGSGEIETDSETPCREGNKITVNGNAFLYEGHYFTEWNTNPDGSGERWNPDTVYNILGNDVKLYAQWKKNPDEKEEEASQDYNNQRKYPVYNLIYHSNNKKEQIEADEENSRLAGTLLTVNENRFSYPGFTFKGWNTRKDGKGKQYTPEEVVEMPARNLNLYAQWEKRPVYHLQYDANNGSGKRRTDAETPCEAGTKVQIDGNAYRYEAGRDCYMFTQWNRNQYRHNFICTVGKASG